MTVESSFKENDTVKVINGCRNVGEIGTVIMTHEQDPEIIIVDIGRETLLFHITKLQLLDELDKYENKKPEPKQVVPKEKEEFRDHKNNTFSTKKEMCNYWKTTVRIYNKKIKEGLSLREALTPEIEEKPKVIQINEKPKQDPSSINFEIHMDYIEQKNKENIKRILTLKFIEKIKKIIIESQNTEIRGLDFFVLGLSKPKHCEDFMWMIDVTALEYVYPYAKHKDPTCYTLYIPSNKNTKKFYLKRKV